MNDYLMPERCRHTRKVEIYFVPNCFITGFKFFSLNLQLSKPTYLPQEQLIFEIGTTNSQGIQVKAVEIGADEQIIGIKACVF